MNYLETIRSLRRILMYAFIINLTFITLAWIFIMGDFIDRFMWAMPGMTTEIANLFMFQMVGMMDVLGLVFFLIPAIALSIEVACEKRRAKREMMEWEEFEAKMMAEIEEISKPAPKKITKKKVVKKSRK